MPGKTGIPSEPSAFRPVGALSPVVSRLAAVSGRLRPFPPATGGGNDGILSPTRAVGGTGLATEHVALDSVRSELTTFGHFVQSFVLLDLRLLTDHEYVYGRPLRTAALDTITKDTDA